MRDAGRGGTGRAWQGSPAAPWPEVMSTRETRSAAVRSRPVRLRAGLQRALEAITEAPAMVLTGRLDVVATNRLGRALLAPVLEEHVNLARFLFLDEEAATAFYPEWDRVADEQVHRLRIAAASDPQDKALHQLVGALSTGSAPFRRRWSAKRFCACSPPRVRVSHPVVGDLDLPREELIPAIERDLSMRIYTAASGTATDERLSILAGWTP